MIDIKEMSRPFDEIETYLMTVSPAMKSIKDVEDGTSIAISGTMLFEDIDEEDGEVTEILSIITPEQEVFASQSKTFRRSLADIQRIMKDKPFSIIKQSGTTKANRPYVNCILDVASLRK